MKIKLNPSTKEAFISIVSTIGIDKIQTVFHSFLKDGRPLKIEKFAALMDVSEDDAFELAQNKGELNQQGELVGFLGLSVVPTNHIILINDKKLYTWCAADTLIFPAILNTKVEIHSQDPTNATQIKITVDNDYLTSIMPSGVMISWVDEVDDSDIRCSMCNRVHFFASDESAIRWHSNNQDARIFSVVDFYSHDISKTNCC